MSAIATAQEDVSPVDSRPDLLDLGKALYRPFSVDRIGFLPKSPVRDKTDKDAWKAKAFPFAEVWDYKSRLHEYAFGAWSIEDSHVITLKDRLVVLLKVVVCGISTWGVGEEMLKGTISIVDENAVRSAWAMAFKRACANFGLGLYLYFLGEPEYVPYDHDRDLITASVASLASLAERLYEGARKRRLLELEPGRHAANLAELRPYLEEPFSVKLVRFLPHSVNRDAKTCTAVPYVSVWHYIRRLNAVAYGHWEIGEQPKIVYTDQKVIVSLKLSLFGHPMVGIGEEFWSQSRWDNGKQITVPRDNAVENAWALAVKRALQAFGLGLYLRALPDREGVPYEYGKVSEPLPLAISLYKQAGLAVAGSKVAIKGSGQQQERRGEETQEASEHGGTSTGGETRMATVEQVAQLLAKGMEADVLRRYRVASLGDLTFVQAASELTRRGSASTSARLRPTG